MVLQWNAKHYHREVVESFPSVLCCIIIPSCLSFVWSVVVDKLSLGRLATSAAGGCGRGNWSHDSDRDSCVKAAAKSLGFVSSDSGCDDGEEGKGDESKLVHDDKDDFDLDIAGK